jgi:hypothetical protein
MDDASAVLIRLADPAARVELLDAEALLEIAAVCYAVERGAVVGTTTAVYDRFDVAVPVLPEVVASARISRAGEPVPWDMTASWDGLVPLAPGADAVWAGSVVLRTARGGGTVEAVAAREPDLDAAFAAALAGLPPTATEEEIRAALRAAARSELAAPPLTDTELDAVLAAVEPGSTDPRGLGRVVGGRESVGLRVTMSPPVDVATAPPLALPVVVAFLVADAAVVPRELLRATAGARRAARAYPVRSVPRDAPARAAERCVCWVLPAAAFDDDGWPGDTGGDAAQQRADRLAAARSWLATQGIALLTT